MNTQRGNAGVEKVSKALKEICTTYGVPEMPKDKKDMPSEVQQKSIETVMESQLKDMKLEDLKKRHGEIKEQFRAAYTDFRGHVEEGSAVAELEVRIQGCMSAYDKAIVEKRKQSTYIRTGVEQRFLDDTPAKQAVLDLQDELGGLIEEQLKTPPSKSQDAENKAFLLINPMLDKLKEATADYYYTMNQSGGGASERELALLKAKLEVTLVALEHYRGFIRGTQTPAVIGEVDKLVKGCGDSKLPNLIGLGVIRTVGSEAKKQNVTMKDCFNSFKEKTPQGKEKSMLTRLLEAIVRYWTPNRKDDFESMLAEERARVSKPGK